MNRKISRHIRGVYFARELARVDEKRDLLFAYRSLGTMPDQLRGGLFTVIFYLETFKVDEKGEMFAFGNGIKGLAVSNEGYRTIDTYDVDLGFLLEKKP